jgi:hypothetical protein
MIRSCVYGYFSFNNMTQYAGSLRSTHCTLLFVLHPKDMLFQLIVRSQEHSR